jgi:hypothetical protein
VEDGLVRRALQASALWINRQPYAFVPVIGYYECVHTAELNRLRRENHVEPFLTIAACVIGLAAAAPGCNQSTNPVRPSALSEGRTSVATGAGSQANAAFTVGEALAEVRRATVRFHDISAAYTAGYTTEFEPCVEIPGGPVMGVHARNEALMGDQTVDPLRPELLLYEPTPTGGFRLVGVEYFQIVLVHDGDPNTNDAPTPWFGHQEPPSERIVGPTPQLFGQRFDGPMEGHIPQMPWHWDLHAWIWQANPDGILAPFNPTIRCR